MLVLGTVLLAALAAPQDVAPRALLQPFQEPDLVRGKIVGVDGEPLPAGTVQARFELQPDGRFVRETVLAVLRQTPLPPLRVADDGTLVLPLTELHRSRLVPELGAWSVVVEAEGHRPWRQMLDRGPGSLVSIDARLSPLTAQDRCRIDWSELGLPERSGTAVLLVRHWMRSSAGGRAQTWSLDAYPLDAGEDGREVAVLEAPDPPVWSGSGIVEWGAQLLAFDPQVGTLHAASLRPGEIGGLELEEVAGPASESPLLFRSGAMDGPLVEGVEVTLSGPIGRFEVRVGASGALRVPKGYRAVLVRAEGHRATDAIPRTGDLPLVRCDSQVPLRVDVRGTEGQSLAGVSVVAESLELMQGSGPIALPLPRPRFRGRTGADGSLEIPARSLEAPIQLRVDSPEHELFTALDPRPNHPSHRVDVRLRPFADGSEPLRVTVLDPTRAPVRQALVLGLSRGRGPARPLVARTDAEGVAVLPAWRASSGRGLCVLAPEHLALIDRRAGDDSDTVELSVVPSRLVGLLVVDEEGRPIPGTWLSAPGHHGGNEGRGADLTDRPVLTESSGRTWLRLAADDDVVSLAQQQFNDTVGERQAETLDGPIEFVGKRSRSVRVLGQSDGWFARLAQIRGGGATTGGVTAPPEGPRSGAFLMRWMMGEQLEIRIGAMSGTTLRLTDAGVELGAESASGLVTLDHRKPRRRIPFAVKLAEGAPAVDLGEARVEYASPHFSGGLYSNAMGDMLTVDADGSAWLELWEPAASKFRLLHPQLQVVEFPVDAEPAAKPVEVAAKRAVRATLQIGVDDAGWKSLYITLTPPGGGEALRFQELISVTAADARRGWIDWVVPAGLVPGTWQVSAHGDVQKAEEEIEVAKDVGAAAFDLRTDDGR